MLVAVLCKALSIKFANEVWHVAESALCENLLKELNQQIKFIHPYPLDVTDIEKCQTVFKTTPLPHPKDL